MINAKQSSRIDSLIRAFQSGYANAAQALSTLTQERASFRVAHQATCSLDDGDLAQQEYNLSDGTLHLLTTEVFGDITGKSYLFLSDHELEFVTRKVPVSKDVTVNLREEFTKELDNILSAAVITKLSNELQVKMYGDIPVLAGKMNGKVQDIIQDDFNEQSEEVFISFSHLSFDEHPGISPLFVWVFDSHRLKI